MTKTKLYIITALVLLLIPSFFTEPHRDANELGRLLPMWSFIPFIGMLLSIALFPLLKQHWWEKNLFNVAAIWSLIFLVPFAIVFGPYLAGYYFYEVITHDYLPFIILLLGLFTVSGGIVIKGTHVGSPKVNFAILIIGTLLASWIGTTGASVLLIRPVLRANSWRKKKAHIIVFFIFLVSNMGGALTPIGDPPLFLGFLRGVPFFWTMQLAPMLILNASILLFVFLLLDRNLYNKEITEGNIPPAIENKEPIKIEGAHNFIFLFMIIGSVILAGILGKTDSLKDPSSNEIIGVSFAYGITIPINILIEMLIVLLAVFLSIRTTKKEYHVQNNFNWGPIKEVACIFIGIFITMIPVLVILHAHGTDLGIYEPWQFFWAVGILSSFLDNAPTYLVFMTTASAIPTAGGLMTYLGPIAPQIQLAVSAGAVFMGANTYIGNAPNFMVRTIAEDNGVKMPSFFGYMGWAGCFLIPLFILNTIVFFAPN